MGVERIGGCGDIGVHRLNRLLERTVRGVVMKLTDEQITEIRKKFPLSLKDVQFARAIEAAVLAQTAPVNTALLELLSLAVDELKFGNPRDIATDKYRYDNELIHRIDAAIAQAKKEVRRD